MNLGNRMTEKLAKNPKILDNHDLIKAAGEAIGYILREVAKSDRLIAIAETKNLPYPEQALDELAEKTPGYWLDINTSTADLSRGLNISEDQLTKIFSADAEEFDRVTGLTPARLGNFPGGIRAPRGQILRCGNRGICGGQTVHNFPESLPRSAETGCGEGRRKVCGDAVESSPNCFG